MKNKDIFIGLIGLIILLGFLAFLPFGCAEEDKKANDFIGASPAVTGSPTPVYACSGKIVEYSDETTPVIGAQCTLIQQSTTPRAGFISEDIMPKGTPSPSATSIQYVSSVTTDTNGNYTFDNVPRGTFILKTTAPNHVTLNSYVSVAGNVTEFNNAVINFDIWNTVYGSEHPYNANYGYVEISVDDGYGNAIEGAVINSGTSGSYLAEGYLVPTMPTIVDWNLTSTNSTSTGFFYGVTPDVAIAYSATKRGYSFQSISITTKKGEITYANLTTLTSPSSSPIPSPTSTKFVGLSGIKGDGMKRLAFGLALMAALSCVVLLKKS